MKFLCKFLRTFFISLLIFLLFTAGCIFYSFKIEPYRLAVNKYYLTEKKQETESIKVVQFSDTHIKEDFTYENFILIAEDEDILHRPGVKLPCLRNKLLFTHFMSGFADGVDQYFAEIVLEKKKTNPALEIRFSVGGWLCLNI